MTIQEKFDLSGRVAIVTGGVGLLGSEFCKTLAEAGATVAVVDLNASASQTVADTLTKSGYKAQTFAVDITQPNPVHEDIDPSESRKHGGYHRVHRDRVRDVDSKGLGFFSALSYGM